ncbi:BRN [Mytilus coruscus]|uniref:Hexosyltransferase n=1 Tax=Mytilus coruscus TaxID=42192 RepID=A0A6J8EPF4_MYTCO|nr:BRN [Mytilus coruscus]
MLRRCWTGEKFYFIQFTFPLNNLIDVVHEIETTGWTVEKPLNNVTKHYVIKKDPSIIKFCSSEVGFADTYDSLVYKTIIPIDWLVKRNITTKYVHFLDDDRLVNTRRLHQFAVDSLGTTESKIIGYKLRFRQPFRTKSSKWFTTLEEYPFDFWPPYIIGGTILTNMKVVKNLAYAIPFTKIIKMEDA